MGVVCNTTGVLHPVELKISSKMVYSTKSYNNQIRSYTKKKLLVGDSELDEVSGTSDPFNDQNCTSCSSVHACHGNTQTGC